MTVQFLFLVVGLLVANKNCELCPLENGITQTRGANHLYSGAQPSGGINALSNEPFVYAIDNF